MPVRSVSCRFASAGRTAVAAGAGLAAAFLATALFAEPAAAHAAGLQPAPVGVGYWTPGRIWSVVAGTAGLAGVVTGGLALARAAVRARAATVRPAGTAVAAGLACAVIGAVVVAAAEGGPGTGYGIVGGFIDLVIGPAAIALGGLALARARRTAAPGS